MSKLTDEQIRAASLKAGMQEHYMGFHSGFIRFARAIEAEVLAQQQQAAHGAVQDGWQPIETAPKDSVYRDGNNHYSQYILAWWPGSIAPVRVRWWYRDDSDACNFLADGGWAAYPTHWMPLPAAPKPQEPGA